MFLCHYVEYITTYAKLVLLFNEDAIKTSKPTALQYAILLDTNTPKTKQFILSF